MNEDLGFSNAVFGLGAGIFFLGYFILEVPGSAIMTKIGARKWISRIMITWAIIGTKAINIAMMAQVIIIRLIHFLAPIFVMIALPGTSNMK